MNLIAIGLVGWLAAILVAYAGPLPVGRGLERAVHLVIGMTTVSALLVLTGVALVAADTLI